MKLISCSLVAAQAQSFATNGQSRRDCLRRSPMFRRVGSPCLKYTASPLAQKQSRHAGHVCPRRLPLRLSYEARPRLLGAITIGRTASRVFAGGVNRVAPVKAISWTRWFQRTLATLLQSRRESVKTTQNFCGTLSADGTELAGWRLCRVCSRPAWMSICGSNKRCDEFLPAFFCFA